MMGGGTSLVNSQDQTVHSGNYFYSSTKVASMIEKNNLQKIIMAYPNHITLHAVKQGVHSAEIWPQCSKNQLQNPNQSYLDAKDLST